jgi:hypothetical protein
MKLNQYCNNCSNWSPPTTESKAYMLVGCDGWCNRGLINSAQTLMMGPFDYCSKWQPKLKYYSALGLDPMG